MSYADIKEKIRLHTGEKQALVVQEFQSLMQVVQVAFGAPEKEKPKIAETVAEVKSGFSSVFL